MNREKLAWSASVALLAVVAFQVPGTLAQRDDDYAFVRTLADVHRRVADNYVDPVDEAKLKQASIEGMLEQLDPYTNYVPPEHRDAFDQMLTGNFKGVGIKFDQRPDGTFEVVTPVDGSPAAASEIEPGDTLLAVDGKPLIGLTREQLPELIRGPIDTDVTLTVRHPDGRLAEVKLKRAEVHQPDVKGYARRPDQSWDYLIRDQPRLGYVRLSEFTGSSHDEVRAAIDQLVAQHMTGLVLDLRFNGGGELDQAERIINMLVPKGRTILTTRGRVRPEHRDVSDGQDFVTVGKSEIARPTLPNFPLVVLVNDNSASASEIVSGSLMDNNRAVVVGQRTFGKGSVQDVVDLPDGGGVLKMTVAYYYLPSGRLVHRRKDAADWGVQPQVSVVMDAAAEANLVRQWDAAEIFRRKGATTRPTTRPGDDDPQLHAAIDTLLGILVFRTDPPATATRPVGRI